MYEFIPSAPAYCVSGATSSADSRIENVTIESINNSSTGCDTYTDFTAISTDLFIGQIATLNVTAGTCNTTNYAKGIKAYIDWNGDGDFDDAQENVLNSSITVSPFTSSDNITVPSFAVLGPTRMRIVCRETSNLSFIQPCGTYLYGETEDYTINITAAPIGYCIPNPPIGTTDGDFINGVSLGAINTTNTGSVTGPNYTYFNLSTDIARGLNYTAIVQGGTWLSTASTQPDYYAIWIDYNHDGDFEDAGERVAAPQAQTVSTFQNLSFNFTVPATADTGTTRMRVRCVYGISNLLPCPDYSYGETEDYNVNILPAAAVVATISVGNLSGTAFCIPAVGQALSVPFTVTGTFNSGNVFTAQLSDASGSFATPTSIGTLTGTGSGTISATLPHLIPAGTNYRIRVLASSPSTVSSTSVALNLAPVPSTPAITANGPLTFCSGGDVELSAFVSTNVNYLWSTGATTLMINVSQAGSYSVRVIAAGCTSAVSAATVVQVSTPPATPTITANGPLAFCNGGNVQLTASTGTGITHLWSNGVATNVLVVSTSGTYTVQTIQNGCTSAVSAPVVVLVNSPSPPINLSASICTGQSYAFGSQTLTTAGTYNQIFTNASGCDSVVTLNLTVSPPVSSNLSASICTGQSYTFGSQTLTAAGTYNQTFTNASGCDSVVTLTLIVNPTTSSSLSASICAGQSYAFGSQTLTAAGTYNQTLTNASGCDSVVTLNLTFSPAASSSLLFIICSNDTYNFNGIILNSSGVYFDTLTAVSGCDSVVTLSLIVEPLPVVPLPVYSNGTLSVPFTGASGYQWFLNGNPIGGATSATFTPTVSGNYSVEIMGLAGCEGISPPLAVVVTSLSQSIDTKNEMAVYPNPVREIVYIDGVQAGQQYNWVLYDASGRQVLAGELQADRPQVDVHTVSDGLYMLRVVSSQGQASTFKVMKAE